MTTQILKITYSDNSSKYVLIINGIEIRITTKQKNLFIKAGCSYNQIKK